MAQNRIQFQPRMSMPAFIAQYGTEVGRFGVRRPDTQ